MTPSYYHEMGLDEEPIALERIEPVSSAGAMDPVSCRIPRMMKSISPNETMKN